MPHKRCTRRSITTPPDSGANAADSVRSPPDPVGVASDSGPAPPDLVGVGSDSGPPPPDPAPAYVPVTRARTRSHQNEVEGVSKNRRGIIGGAGGIAGSQVSSPRRDRGLAVHFKELQCDDGGDGKHIKLRWSSARVVRVVKALNPVQKEYITKFGFGFILNVKNFRVPVCFIEWVMSNTSSSFHEFIFKQNCIRFTKDIVKKVLGIHSGNIVVEVDSSDFEAEALVEKYKSMYKVGHTYPIKKLVQLMTAEQDEEKFMRHFMLFFISTILMLGKSNCVCVEYLYSLLDLSLLQQYDWAEEVLHVIMHEVCRFRGFRDCLGRIAAMKNFYMEGCLPLLAIVYADFLDLPLGSPNVHSLNYAVPRICNLSSIDFDFVMDIDRDTNDCYAFGVHPLRDISDTPYRTSEPIEAGNPETIYHADVQELVNKQNNFWKSDLLNVVESLNNVLHARVRSHATDFSTLYKSKLDELDALDVLLPMLVHQIATWFLARLCHVVEMIHLQQNLYLVLEMKILVRILLKMFILILKVHLIKVPVLLKFHQLLLLIQ